MIIYRYFWDVEENGEENLNVLYENTELLRSLGEVRNKRYRDRVLQIFFVYSCSSDNKDATKEIESLISNLVEDEQMKSFFSLASLLVKNRGTRFCYEFEEFVKETKNKFGEYYKILLKNDVRLLVKITNLRKMFSSQSFIFEKFPYVEVNATILKSFQELKDFTQIIVDTFEVNEIQELEELYVEDTKHIKLDMYMSGSLESLNDSDFEKEDTFLHALFKSIKSMIDGTSARKSKNFVAELKRFIFGRSIKRECSETVFESILSKRNTCNLIRAIWKAFDLSSYPEILTLVRKFR